MAKLMPWDQREGETAKAYAAFVAYRDLGISRSLERAAEKEGKAVQNFARWSRANDWIKRADSFDRHQAGFERSLASRRILNTAKMRLKLRQGAYEIAKALIPQIKAMLDAPLWEDTIDENGIKIRMPAKWSKGTIGQLTTALATLAKFSLDDGLSEELAFDPVTASPEECRAWAERVKEKLSVARGLDG